MHPLIFHTYPFFASVTSRRLKYHCVLCLVCFCMCVCLCDTYLFSLNLWWWALRILFRLQGEKQWIYCCCMFFFLFNPFKEQSCSFYRVSKHGGPIHCTVPEGNKPALQLTDKALTPLLCLLTCFTNRPTRCLCKRKKQRWCHHQNIIKILFLKMAASIWKLYLRGIS